MITTKHKTKAMQPFTYTPTKLMSQQVEALRLMACKEGFALLMEQGTGKTLVMIEELLRLYAAGEVDGMLVLAPNGVHENWVLTELPAHMPKDVPYVASYYISGASKRQWAAINRIYEPRPPGGVSPIRVLTMSYDALLTEQGFKFAEGFLLAVKCYLVADESHSIKSPGARRTKRALNLARLAPIRRIATGTPITAAPLDAFSQFEFLGEGLLGTDSFSAFRAEYCELLPHGHGLVKHLVQKMERARGRKMSEREIEFAGPKLIAQDEHGRPKFKNLDKLHALIAAHSYRVLKEECIDLPPKVYQTVFFHLSKSQRAVYEKMEEEYRYLLEDGTALITSKLVAMAKLRQITSGFVLMRDGTVSYLQDNPRIDLLRSETEGETRQGIIWAEYVDENVNIARALREMGMKAEQVYGATPMGKRQAIRDAFQAGDLQWIVAHPKSMGTGFTLTAAELVYYYSNGFELGARLQSEDRAHRIGQTKTVLYRDFVAIDTRDDNVVWALQHKLDTSAMILGDPARESRFARPN